MHDELEELTADDFVLGLFAELSRRHTMTVSMREKGFYTAMKASFDRLQELLAASPGQVEMTFRVKLDPLYGDSAVVRNAINAAVQRTFLSLDNPEFVTIRSKLNERQASATIAHLPGRPEWYSELADVFLQARDGALTA